MRMSVSDFCEHRRSCNTGLDESGTQSVSDRRLVRVTGDDDVWRTTSPFNCVAGTASPMRGMMQSATTRSSGVSCCTIQPLGPASPPRFQFVRQRMVRRRGRRAACRDGMYRTAHSRARADPPSTESKRQSVRDALGRANLNGGAEAVPTVNRAESPAVGYSEATTPPPLCGAAVPAPVRPTDQAR